MVQASATECWPNFFYHFFFIFLLVMPKCQPREFPRSGTKAIDVEEREKVSDYNGQYLLPEPINSVREEGSLLSLWRIQAHREKYAPPKQSSLCCAKSPYKPNVFSPVARTAPIYQTQLSQGIRSER